MSDNRKIHETPFAQRRRLWLAVVGGAVALSAAAGLAWHWSGSSTREDADKSATETLQPKVTPTADTGNPRGYVGIEACAKCHAERAKEFKGTRHYLACMLPDPAQMPAAFNLQEGKLKTPDPTLQFEMVKEGKDFVQKAVRARPEGEPQQVSSVISFVYGQGGSADQVYFSWRGDRLYELPVARLLRKDEWGTSSFDPNGSGDFARETTPRCLECHNTWFKQIPGSFNAYDRHDILLGVTCEKCHGAGRDHAAWHGTHPGEKSAHDILHPGHLPRERLMAVCGQCHSNTAKYSAEPFSYKPGEPLDAYFKTLESRFPEDNHVANQDKYLRQSKCYQHSETLTCVSCHDPHRTQEHATASRQKTCLKCHQADKCTDRPNLPAEVRDNCIGCHMPLVDKIQVNFRTAKDAHVPPAKRYEHKIGIYPLQRKELLWQWRQKQKDPESQQVADKLAAELSRDWTAQGDEYLSVYRLLAATDAYRQAERIRSTPEIKSKLNEVIERHSKFDRLWFQAAKEIQEQKFAAAADTLESALQLKPDHPLVHGKLGSVYASLGKMDVAREHLEAVARLDPDEPYGESMLGWLAYLEGNHSEALEHYLRAAEMEPRNVKVKYNMGLAQLGLAQWSEATTTFRNVLAIDPNHPGAYQGLGHALRQQGQNEEGLKNSLLAAELTRFGNPDILLSLADAYSDAGRLRDAQNTATRALALAGKDEKLVARIMVTLNELQLRGQRSP